MRAERHSRPAMGMRPTRMAGQRAGCSM
jgi:hypothetical protein